MDKIDYPKHTNDLMDKDLEIEYPDNYPRNPMLYLVTIIEALFGVVAIVLAATFLIGLIILGIISLYSLRG